MCCRRVAQPGGYLLKSDANHFLLSRRRQSSTVLHQPGFGTTVVISAAQQHKPEFALSPRETLVVRLIAEGHGNKEVGSILISAQRRSRPIAHPPCANSLTSTAALVRYAVRTNWLSCRPYCGAKTECFAFGRFVLAARRLRNLRNLDEPGSHSCVRTTSGQAHVLCDASSSHE